MGLVCSTWSLKKRKCDEASFVDRDTAKELQVYNNVADIITKFEGNN